MNVRRVLEQASSFLVMLVLAFALVGNPTTLSARHNGSVASNQLSYSKGSLGNSSSGLQQFSVVPTSIPRNLSGATLVGPLSTDEQLNLQLVLSLRNTGRLNSFLGQVYDPGSPLYHHFLNPSQFYSLYGPDPAEVAGLTTYMQSHGLRIQISATNPDIAEVTGTVSQIQNALRTQIDSFNRSGKVFYSATSQAQLPQWFSNVQMIYGLENLSQAAGAGAVPFYRTLGQVTPSQTPSGLPVYYSPSEISQMYNATSLHNAGYTGTGVSIAIIDAYGDPYVQQELQNFSAEFGLPLSNGTLHIIPVGPYNPENGITSGWNLEVALDVEWAHAMAPDAAINLYVAANSGSSLFEAVLNATLGSDGTAYGVYHNNIISMSWGLPENDIACSTPGNYPWLDQVFQMAAAMGITSFASSGDWGAYDGQTSPYGGASYPSTDPYVTGVGGTTLYMNSTAGYYQWPIVNATGTYGNETAWSWNNYYGWGTGGGWSTLFGQPSWQTGPGVVNNGERGNPDVAWDADPQTGVLMSVFNSTAALCDYYMVGGTSVGVPCWAGSMALIDQKAGMSLGFVNPMMYSVLRDAAEYSKAFHDVVVGDNNPDTATRGWDPLTGVGSPNLGELANCIACTGQLSVVVTNDFTSVSGLGRAYSYGQVINMTAVVADNGTISGPVIGTITSSTGTIIASNVAFSYDAPAGAWHGTYLIKPTDPSGEWLLTVTAMNASSEGKGYAAFAVGDTVTFVNPPYYSGQFFQVGNYVRVYCHVVDPDGNFVTSGVYTAIFYLAQNQTIEDGLGKVEGEITLQYSSSDSQWEGSFTITKSADQGAWTILVNGTDLKGNQGSAYTWINVGLIVSPFTDSPTYVLGDTISIFAYTVYLNGSEVKNGTFTAEVYSGPIFEGRVPLAFTHTTGLGAYFDLLGLWEGVFKLPLSNPTGFYTITANGTDGLGNYGSFDTVARIARYSLSIRSSVSNPVVPVQNGNESWILAKVTYPNGGPMTVGSVVGYLHTSASGADNSTILNWFPMTYSSRTGGFFAVNVFHAVNATETVIGNYTVDVEAYDALGNYGNISISFSVSGTPASFAALTVTAVDASTLKTISGATVQAVGLRTYSAKTNSSGTVVFGEVQVGDYHVSANATGYLPSANVLAVITNSTGLTIRLWPISTVSDWWPTFMHDPEHTGCSTSEAPSTNQTLWTYQTTGSVVGMCPSPAVVGGIVYVGGQALDPPYYHGGVFALSAASGALIWFYYTGGYVYSSPTVAYGMVYVGSTDDCVYALNASTGKLVWIYATGNYIMAAPAVADGLVFIGSMDLNIYALNAKTGKLVWKYLTKSDPTFTMGVYAGPAVAGGIVYEGALDGYVYALNDTTGQLIWSHQIGFQCCYAPPAVVNGVVFIGASGPVYGGGYDWGAVFALNAKTGAQLWSYYFSDWGVQSCPAVANGLVYIGSTNDTVYALNASTGVTVWSYKTGNSVCSSAAVAGGILFIGSNDGHLYAFNATTGKIVWSYKTGSGVGSPAVVGGVVFVGAGGKVYAFGQAPTYSVSFSESGLPKGVQWAVTFNGQTKNSTSKVITFNATIGVYPFSITPPLGYVALPSAGSITVNGVSLTEQITFKAIYEVSFVESSLPQGVQWSVTFNGQTLSSTSNSIGFIAVNGVYFFSITPPTGHSALPSSGTIIVDGTDVTQQIMFIPMSVSVSNIRIIEGDTVNVNITLGNEGNDTETFNVTLYDNQNGQSWRIYMFTDVALAPSSTITLSIDGLDFGVGSHTLTVNACSLIGPTYTCTSASIVVASIGLFRPWIWHHLIQV